MTRILHIAASPKGEHSTSAAVAAAFLDAVHERSPRDEIRTLDVWSRDVPQFGRDHAFAKFAPLLGQARSPEQQRAWQEVEETIRELDAADKLVLSCPMWNYGIPHALKNYIDVIVQPGLTFGYDAATKEHLGLLRDRPTQLLLTRSSVAPGDPHDFQLPYLEHILAFIGIRDVRSLVAGATTQPPDRRDAYVREQCDRARSAAADF